MLMAVDVKNALGGNKKIEMQFMADLFLECDACKGKGLKKHIRN